MEPLRQYGMLAVRLVLVLTTRLLQYVLQWAVWALTTARSAAGLPPLVLPLLTTERPPEDEGSTLAWMHAAKHADLDGSDAAATRLGSRESSRRSSPSRRSAAAAVDASHTSHDALAAAEAPRPARIAVLGSGSFGTALGSVLARNGHEVVLLTLRPEVAAAINNDHKNPSVPFSDMVLPFNLRASCDAATVLSGAEWVVHAVPVQASLECLRAVAHLIPPTVPIISASKGLYCAQCPTPQLEGDETSTGAAAAATTSTKGGAKSAAVSASTSTGTGSSAASSGGGKAAAVSKAASAAGSHMFMNELIPAALGRSSQPTAFLSGPTFAAELMQQLPSGAVVASTDIALAKQVAHLFMSPSLRIFYTTDVAGVEAGGALKNVFAIASGALEGLGLGANTQALLCTRAISEMARIASALGSRDTTLAGLAGIGDLVLTSYGSASRNRSVGVRLGKGEKIEDILSSMSEVAEGVYTAPAAVSLAHKLGVEVPIMEAVATVLAGEAAPLSELLHLLTLPTGREHIL